MRSHGNDVDQILQTGEIRGVPGVKAQVVRVGGRGDEKIGQPGAGLSAFAYHRGHDQAVASNGPRVERNRLHGGFDFLKPGLSFGGLDWRGGEQWTDYQFGSGDG